MSGELSGIHGPRESGLYSQSNEEQVIRDLCLARWGDRGRPSEREPRFLDIGAHNGEMFSNTRRLALDGWGGVCVEPSAGPFRDLVRLYAQSDRVHCVNALVAAGNHSSPLVPFWMTDDGLSTDSTLHHEKWKAQAEFAHVWVPSIPLRALLGVFPGTYDIINIDTEGSSLALLNAFPVETHRVWTVIVEHDGDPSRINEWANRNGFRVHHTSADNSILVRDDLWSHR